MGRCRHGNMHRFRRAVLRYVTDIETDSQPDRHADNNTPLLTHRGVTKPVELLAGCGTDLREEDSLV